MLRFLIHEPWSSGRDRICDVTHRLATAEFELKDAGNWVGLASFTLDPDAQLAPMPAIEDGDEVDVVDDSDGTIWWRGVIAKTVRDLIQEELTSFQAIGLGELLGTTPIDADRSVSGGAEEFKLLFEWAVKSASRVNRRLADITVSSSNVGHTYEEFDARSQTLQQVIERIVRATDGVTYWRVYDNSGTETFELAQRDTATFYPVQVRDVERLDWTKDARNLFNIVLVVLQSGDRPTSRVVDQSFEDVEGDDYKQWSLNGANISLSVSSGEAIGLHGLRCAHVTTTAGFAANAYLHTADPTQFDGVSGYTFQVWARNTGAGSKDFKFFTADPTWGAIGVSPAAHTITNDGRWRLFTETWGAGTGGQYFVGIQFFQAGASELQFDGFRWLPPGYGSDLVEVAQALEMGGADGIPLVPGCSLLQAEAWGVCTATEVTDGSGGTRVYTENIDWTALGLGTGQTVNFFGFNQSSVATTIKAWGNGFFDATLAPGSMPSPLAGHCYLIEGVPVPETGFSEDSEEASSITRFGPRVKVIAFPEGRDSVEAERLAIGYLTSYSTPQQTVECQLTTRQEDPWYVEPGRMLRVLGTDETIEDLAVTTVRCRVASGNIEQTIYAGSEPARLTSVVRGVAETTGQMIVRNKR